MSKSKEIEFVKKFKEHCPLCGKANNRIIWQEDISIPSYPNRFYLCHYCGYFLREHSNGELNEGITFDPRIIPLKTQLRAIRKHHGYYSGLKVEDCRKYKPPKCKPTQSNE